MVGPDAQRQLRQLARAVERLASSADDQLQAFAGGVTTDELALDYESAYALLPSLREQGVSLGAAAEDLAQRLDELLSEPSGSDFWSDVALAEDPAWENVRITARALRGFLPVE